MSTPDHRTPLQHRSRGRSRWPLAARAGPSAASRARRRRSGRRCARSLGVEDRTATAAATRSPSTMVPTARAPRRRSRSSPRAVCGRPSSWSASRCGATPRSPARSSPPATRSACTATAIATCCAWRRGRCARTSRARAGRSRMRAGCSPVLYRPPYGVLNAAALRVARGARLAHAAVEPMGPRLGGARHPRVDRRARHRRRRGGLDPAAARRRRLQRAGLLAAHRGGVARGPGDARRARSAARRALSATGKHRRCLQTAVVDADTRSALTSSACPAAYSLAGAETGCRRAGAVAPRRRRRGDALAAGG